MSNLLKNLGIAICFVIAIGLVGFWISGGGIGAPIEKTEPITNGGEAVTLTVGRDINYFENVTGYFARPNNDKIYPGVVMIHEWWGLNDNIKKTARDLASEGYQVLAVDLYNGKVATTSDEARLYRTSLDQGVATENLKSAVNFLKEKNSPKIASLGWCFGGGQSLELSLSGEVLDATVIYYGTLVTDESALNKIDWPVLGIFGAEDTSISVDSVNKFKKSLDSLSIDNEIYIYPGVGHAFANPSGDNYAEKETADAWTKTLDFLRNSLR